mgnify:CR=1 FL=1
MARKQDRMPKRNKKNFRSTKSGAGMTKEQLLEKLNQDLKLQKDVNHFVQDHLAK